ncbi:MAG: LysM peptidoglycan-binding domain-containing protein [Pirellulales bacterium]
MGRETKILLGLLGLLAGVFVGVLSMKLFVPRPPDGAGPDIHTDHEFVETHQVVEPPALAPLAWDFAAAPPLVSDAGATPPSPVPAETADTEPPPATDPFVQRTTAIERPLDSRQAERAPPPAEPALLPATVADDLLPTPAETIASEPLPARFPVRQAAAIDLVEPPAELPPAAHAAISAGGSYTVQAGESWWSLAEQAYGDGRLYRALFAWNRVLDPRVALAPGTVLEIPPLPKLEAAWPKLMPPPAP